MQKSGIEYLDFVWNFYTGCKNQETGVCTLPCWAKAQAHRFGRSFEPTFHFGIFNTPMPKAPARIGVCFTGDLFGAWANPLTFIFERIKDHPEHQFFFLTKCPGNIKKWAKFPDNAWVGVTALNAEQVWLAVEALKGVDAKHKWLSLEPLQGDIFAPSWELNRYFTGIDWIVVGAQSHPTVLPWKEWVWEIGDAAKKAGIPYWLKNNLKPLFFPEKPYFDLRQEFALTKTGWKAV